MADASSDFDRISPAIIMIQSWEAAVAFRGFNLIDKDFSWNEFCFIMDCDQGVASEAGDAAEVGLIGDELLATR